ncbi:MAG: HAD-IIIA family hydrolase [Crocinitomicaceae bacterium]|jgi:histidinol-phosphate phosphatase family protein
MNLLDWNVDDSWTLFLDRDGVINERIMGGYVTNLSDFHFKEKVLESLGNLTRKFKYVFVVTNQQGVSLGKMTQMQLDEIHEFMVNEIVMQGGHVTHVFSATELKNSDSTFRKPSPKIAYMAQERFPQVDFQKSIMVGDTDSDIRFGKNLGMKTVLILTEEKTREKADLELGSLFELNELLEK